MNSLNDQLFLKNHVFAGFGNPLLDISAVIKTADTLHTFNLKPDGQCEVDAHFIHQVIQTLERLNYEITKNPGGCVQNTLRIVQALVKQSGFCVFFGGLGSDSDGVFLESEVKKCGVDTRYAKHSAQSTGKVAALIYEDKRSLVAHVGAAGQYRLQDFKTPANLKILEEVFLVYIEGFFITHSLDVALEVINICRSKGVIVAFNISGAYVAEVHSDKLLAIVTLADIVIGNDAELKELGRVIGLKANTLVDVALETQSFLCEKNTQSVHCKLSHMNYYGKLLIVTQGRDPIVCVYGDKTLLEFTVPFLDETLIKDTTGAGDSFAAGFLVAFIQNKSIKECLAFGCEIAQKVIQQIGVVLPND